MREAYEMSQIIKPSKPRPDYVEAEDGSIIYIGYIGSSDPWAFCDIFGFRYCHGYLYESSSTARASFSGLKKEFEDKHKHECLKSSEKLKLFEIEVMAKAEKEIYIPLQKERLETAKKKYLTEEIIARVLAFDQDPEHFWYALLLLTDYVETKKPNALFWLSPMKEISKFIKELDYIKYNPNLDLDGQCQDRKYDLHLSIDEKTVLRICSPATLHHISRALSDYSSKMKGLHQSTTMQDDLDLSLFDSDSWAVTEDYRNIKVIYKRDMRTKESDVNGMLFRLYWFRFYLDSYLSRNKHKRTRNCSVKDFIKDSNAARSTQVSINKEEFISDLARIMLPNWDGKLIKDMLKNHKSSLPNGERYKGWSEIYDQDI